MSQGGAPLATVDRALKLLLCFDSERVEWTVTELSTKLGYSKSMVHRLLRTFMQHDFIAQDPETSRYRLGMSVLRLSDGVGGPDDLRLTARAAMRELAAVTKQTCVLTIVDGMQAVSIHKIDSPERIKVTLRVGYRSPLYAGASAKVLLAFLPESEQEAVIEGGLTAMTDNTVQDANVLRKQLQQIREQGYCITNSELDSGLAGIAAPIYNHTGQVVAGVSIVGLAQGFNSTTDAQLIEQTKAAAARISAKLGWQPT